MLEVDCCDIPFGSLQQQLNTILAWRIDLCRRRVTVKLSISDSQIQLRCVGSDTRIGAAEENEEEWILDNMRIQKRLLHLQKSLRDIFPEPGYNDSIQVMMISFEGRLEQLCLK